MSSLTAYADNNEDERMTNASNIINFSQKRKISYTSIILWGFLIFFLLLMRDSFSVGINKYIFLGIICICAVSMKTTHLIYLFCFLFPLYVGLPGNYMTLVLIVRLIFEVRRFRVSSFMLSLAIAVYMFAQNIITEYTGIVPMMFIAGVVLIFLLFTYKQDLESTPMILMYSAGVAALGFIMLFSTLRVHDLSALMSTAFRLGTSNADYATEGIMRVSVDPNYYGMFSITSISMAFPLIIQPKTKPIVRICLSIFVLTQLIVSLIGLSRAFILVFVVWILMYLMSQKNFKGTIIALIAIIAIVSILVNFMPNVLETVLARFDDSDMITGNGRITIIQKYWNEYSGSLGTILFGVGLYNCNVHCMPLQFLFGGGLVMFILVTALFFSYIESKMSRRTLFDLLPFIVTFTMMCSVPAAGLLNSMFPLVLIGLSTYNMEETRIVG